MREVEKGTSSLHFLVVDDAVEIRLVVRDLLKMEYPSCRVSEASNGISAMEVMEETGDIPDLVLLDWKMPVKDGIETLKEIRRHSTKAVAETPVILMTAASEMPAQKDVLCSELTGLLTKPFAHEDLFLMIGQKLYFKKKRESRFSLKVRGEIQGFLWVELTGALSFIQVPELQNQLFRLLRESESHLILHLKGLERIDVAGLKSLFLIQKTAENLSPRKLLLLYRPGEFLKEVLLLNRQFLGELNWVNDSDHLKSVLSFHGKKMDFTEFSESGESLTSTALRLDHQEA